MNNTQTYDIFFAIDSNFIEQISVTIASIIINSREEDIFNFYIMCEQHIDKLSYSLDFLKSIKNFEYHLIIIDNSQFKNFHFTWYIPTPVLFFRYLIPNVKPDLHKALYLDCDIVVEKSLYELYNTDLTDNYIGGVEDVHNYYKTKKNDILLGGYSEPYINAGVMLLNLKKMRQDSIVDKFFEIQHELNYRTYIQSDQDVINIVCKSKKHILPLKFNVLTAVFGNDLCCSYNRYEYEEAINNPVIIHFTDHIKPWNNIDSFPINHFHYRYYKYLNFTIFKDRVNKFVNKLKFRNNISSSYRKRLLNNNFLKILNDLLRLPYDIFNFIKSIYAHKIKNEIENILNGDK